MKKIKAGTLALITGLFVAFSACGPNDDGGSTDQKNSDGEGSSDTTRIPNFDSASAKIMVPNLINYSTQKL